MKRSYIKQRGLLWKLARARKVKGLVPKSIKLAGRRFLPVETYDQQKWLAEDPYRDVEETSTYEGKVNCTLGIVKEFTRIHSFYIGACRELGVPYKVVDISGPDWLARVRDCACDAFLVRPSGQITVWKQMFDERLKVITDYLGKTIFPTYNEIWFYESKRRMQYWLEAHAIPHPKTWTFYDRHEALAFGDAIPLPIVYKADFGSGSKGVRIFRDRGQLTRWINRCFKKGIVKREGDRRDRQWGCMLFQEYIPNALEWRIIRIGESYMGYQKLKQGDFASGSHQFAYGSPPTALLNFVRDVTEKGGFNSMAVDVFVLPDDRFLVFELQTTFGLQVDEGLPMKDGRPGRFLYDTNTGTWRFDEGKFCRNMLCNLRVETLLKQLGVSLPQDKPAEDTLFRENRIDALVGPNGRSADQSHE